VSGRWRRSACSWREMGQAVRGRRFGALVAPVAVGFRVGDLARGSAGWFGELVESRERGGELVGREPAALKA
jgi:hypothetical protein